MEHAPQRQVVPQNVCHTLSSISALVREIHHRWAGESADSYNYYGYKYLLLRNDAA